MSLFTVLAVRYGHVSIELASGHISPVVVAELTAFCGLFSCLGFSKSLTIGGQGYHKYSSGLDKIVYV